MVNYTYIFSELDNRALIGALILEILYKDLNFKIVNSPNCQIETLSIKGSGEDKKISGICSIIQYFASKSQAVPEEVDFIWRICYDLATIKTVANGEETTGKVKLNKSVLNELETILGKQAFIGGTSIGDLDIVTFVNINDTVEKKLDKYKGLYPNVVKLLEKVKGQVSPVIEEYSKKFVKKEKKNDEEEKTETIPSVKVKEEKKKPETDKPKNQPKAKVKADLDPSVVEALKKCKIQRLNKGKEILPRPDKRNILVTSALPYVNNVPHLGNIIGCVLSADVYARFARLRGHNVIYICGTDEYGTATEIKALKEGRTPKEICDCYHKIHKDSYEWFDCDFDYFGRTTTEQQTQIAQEIFTKLHQNNLLSQGTLILPHCSKCDIFLADRYIHGICPLCAYEDARGDQCDRCEKLLDSTDLGNPKCEICNSPPALKETEHLFLDLPKIAPELEKWVEKSSVEGGWSNNSIQTTKTWLKQGLKPRCITRDLKWGVPVPLAGFENKVFYVWFDAPIGYISITANYTSGWEKWWKDPENVELVQFMGKDNVPFHTVIFPSSLIGTGDQYTMLHHISTTEYLNYEAGLKFSKSRGTGVFADGAAETKIPSEVWRYYLLINRPEQSDTEFNWEDLATKTNKELSANIGNLCNRVFKFIYDKLDKRVPEYNDADVNERDHAVVEELYSKFIQEYLPAFERVEIKTAFKIAMELSTICNKYTQDEKPWEPENIKSKRSLVVLGVLANLIRFLAGVFEPFIPSFSAKIYHILGKTERTEEDEVLFEVLVDGKSESLLKLIPKGQVISQPLPLFEQISSDDIKEYREKFGGKTTG